jgi:hypothetical protein
MTAILQLRCHGDRETRGTRFVSSRLRAHRVTAAQRVGVAQQGEAALRPNARPLARTPASLTAHACLASVSPVARIHQPRLVHPTIRASAPLAATHKAARVIDRMMRALVWIALVCSRT